jgi:hypothetical protein
MTDQKYRQICTRAENVAENRPVELLKSPVVKKKSTSSKVSPKSPRTPIRSPGEEK